MNAYTTVASIRFGEGSLNAICEIDVLERRALIAPYKGVPFPTYRDEKSEVRLSNLGELPALSRYLGLDLYVEIQTSLSLFGQFVATIQVHRRARVFDEAERKYILLSPSNRKGMLSFVEKLPLGVTVTEVGALKFYCTHMLGTPASSIEMFLSEVTVPLDTFDPVIECIASWRD